VDKGSKGRWKKWFIGLSMPVLVACAGNYGRLQRSNDVGRVFERYEVLADHAYYATGPAARPRAILAVGPEYTLSPGLWRPLEMTAELLRRMVNAMTDYLGFAPAILGGVIVDPAGHRAGVYYSPYSGITIRFDAENTMVVTLPGPDRDPFPTNRNRRPGRLP
jgi:hypothetical protein